MPHLPGLSSSQGLSDPLDLSVESVRQVVEQARRAAGVPSGRYDQAQPEVWDRHDMRRLLAMHDIRNVYRLLQRYGMSQRGIAARTGQAQSEISEIIAGRRVTSYNLLLKICTGLGLPRGWMGLAYDTNTRKLLQAAGDDQ